MAHRAAPVAALSLARICGSVGDVTHGTMSLHFKNVPVCRFTVVSSGFYIPAEMVQLPPSSLPPEEVATNVFTVNVVGSSSFVESMKTVMDEEMVVEVRGRLHAELTQMRINSSRWPSLLLSVERLQNTEDAIRVLHAFRKDTKEVQSQLRRLILEEKGLQ